MHDDLDGYTPSDDLAAGRCCRAQDVGVLAVGVPIGGACYARGVAHERLSAHLLAHRRLSVMPDVQAAYVILRYNCLALRFLLLLRACGPVLREADGGCESPRGGVQRRDISRHARCAAHAP